MNSNDTGNGQRWTRRFRRNAAGESELQSALRSLSPSEYEALRKELMAAVDAVLEKRVGNVATRRGLRATLLSSINNTLQSEARGVPAGTANILVPAEVQTIGKRDSTVDAAINRLRQLAQQAFTQRKPGGAPSASGVRSVLPLLQTHLMPLLEDLVGDERKIAAFRKGAVAVLGRYMSPKTADRVVSVALAAAKRSVQKRRGR